MTKETSGLIGVIYHSDYLIHTNARHPERKERLEHILEQLRTDPVRDAIEFITPREADVNELKLVHEEEYIRYVQDACSSTRHFLDPDTYIVPESFRVALLAVGGSLTGLDELMKGRRTRALALIRPPGHHAEADRAMGFCLFNNIAIAARVAREKYGLEKIAIVDWDVHHGNGTQNTFWNEKEVFYISVHQSPAFPGTGRKDETGGGEGRGYTLNVPLPPGCGDDEYLKTFSEIILPALEEYGPQLVAVSAGQDAYHADPLASMNLTGEGYYRMARAIAGVADRHAQGKMLICLEGGYHLQGQAEALAQILHGIRLN